MRIAMIVMMLMGGDAGWCGHDYDVMPVMMTVGMVVMIVMKVMMMMGWG